MAADCVFQSTVEKASLLVTCIFGAVLRIDAQTTLTTTVTTEMCDVNLTSVCRGVAEEAEAQCKEYVGYGVTECLPWRTVASDACFTSCANCTQISLNVRAQCRFSLQIISNGELMGRLCNETKFSMENYRCPTLRNVNDGRCDTPEAQDCMRDCGNYGGCMCWEQKAIPGATAPGCEGFTRTDTVSHLPGVLISCQMTPLECVHYKESRCGQYHYCQPDMCLIKQVDCTPQEDCSMFHFCDPDKGLCHFRIRPDGYNCSDGFFYTVGDQCQRGVCLGTTDNCLRYNVSCNPLNSCTTGGVCHPHSGRCTYDTLPDGTVCDDGRPYTLEDQCQNGVCVGSMVDLCVERGVVCTSPGTCFDPGTCDPQTGRCSEPVASPDPRACDDGDPASTNDHCIDGLCLGRLSTGSDFLTLGEGECTDREGNRMARYSGDVDNEQQCLRQCDEDPQCTAYSFAYPLCSIYGTVRTRAPRGGRDWSFQEGSLNPPAIAVEQAQLTAIGQRAGTCRRKGTLGDTSRDYGPASRFNTDDFFEPWKVALYCCAVIIVFCFWPILRAFERLFCGLPATMNPIFLDPVPKEGMDSSLWDVQDDQLRVAADTFEGPGPSFTTEPSRPLSAGDAVDNGRLDHGAAELEKTAAVEPHTLPGEAPKPVQELS